MGLNIVAERCVAASAIWDRQRTTKLCRLEPMASPSSRNVTKLPVLQEASYLLFMVMLLLCHMEGSCLKLMFPDDDGSNCGRYDSPAQLSLNQYVVIHTTHCSTGIYTINNQRGIPASHSTAGRPLTAHY